jgi:drug/metabolite transporter (DMT)-like permease
MDATVHSRHAHVRPEERRVTRRALLLFAAMSVIWGIPYLFIRVAVEEITPATLVFWRTAIAAGILLPIALARTDLRPVLARWRWLVVFAAVEIAIPWVALGSAEQHISSSLAALLIAGVPLVGAVIALLTGGADRFGRAGVLGLLIGLVGVAAIVGADLGSSDLTALAQVGIVVVGYAIGPAILARRLDGLPTVAVMSLSLALCAIVFLPISLPQWPATAPSTDALISVVVLAVVCTAAAFILFGALIDAIGPVRATVITYVNPAVAAVLGVVVLNEIIAPSMIVGFVLVIIGSVLATRPAQAAVDPADQVETSNAPDGSTDLRGVGDRAGA